MESFRSSLFSCSCAWTPAIGQLSTSSSSGEAWPLILQSPSPCTAMGSTSSSPLASRSSVTTHTAAVLPLYFFKPAHQLPTHPVSVTVCVSPYRHGQELPQPAECLADYPAYSLSLHPPHRGHPLRLSNAVAHCHRQGGLGTRAHTHTLGIKQNLYHYLVSVPTAGLSSLHKLLVNN